MNTDSAEEERLLRAMSRKPAAAKGVTNKPPEVTPMLKIPSTKPADPPKVISPRGLTNGNNSYAEQIEILNSKKSAVAVSTVTTRRELEEVRVEIDRLKSREAELLIMLERREAATKKLSEEIEALERSSREHSEDVRRKAEEDKVRRAREEEKRKQIEAEELMKRSANPPTYSAPSSPQPTTTSSRIIENPPQRSVSSNLFPARASSVRPAPPPTLEADEEGLNAEEARIMRAMNRKSLAPTSSIKPQTVKHPEPKAQTYDKPAQEPLWKEQERARDAERAARLAGENRKKEEERRIALAREAEARRAEESRVMAIKSREGQLYTFTSPTIFDFDAEVKICGDFTDWREVLLTSQMNDNFTYSITFPMSPGPHFYRFKIGTKWELNKNQQTGVAPTGDVMNKIEI